jgi:hypothetical protein
MTTQLPHSQIRFLTLCAVLMVAGVSCASNSAPVLPAPVPQTNEKVLLEDRFAEYRPQWRQVRGQWMVANGRLQQVRDDAKELNTIMFYEPLTIADAEIDTRATMVAQLPQFQVATDDATMQVKRRVAGAGIVFRYQDENNFYLFRLAGEEGAVLGKVVKGEWSELANPRSENFATPGPTFAGTLLRFGTEYGLRVRVQGGRIQCWINDRAVTNLEDPTFSTGRVGLATFRTQAIFTSIRVVER